VRVWLVQTGESLPLGRERKLRTSLMAEKLLEKGHSLTWWTSAFDHLTKRWLWDKDEEILLRKDFRIVALKGVGYRRNISVARFIDHRKVAAKFRCRTYKSEKPDVVVVSMPPHDLAYEAVRYAKENNIPVIVDIRDLWPDIFVERFGKITRFVMKAALSNDFNMLRKTLKWANSITAVTKPFLEWGLNYAGRDMTPTDKVFYLGCSKGSSTSSKLVSDRIRSLKDAVQGKFTVGFLGTFAHYHNPEIIVDAAERLKDKDIQFIIAGDGEFYDKIQAKANSLPNVHITGWLDAADIYAILGLFHVGVCPTGKDAVLFPNKAFTYLSAGLPIVSAFGGELKEILEKEQIGLYCRPGDVGSLVTALETLYINPSLWQEMAENARKVFSTRFDADIVYNDYSEHIERVAAYAGKRSGM